MIDALMQTDDLHAAEVYLGVRTQQSATIRGRTPATDGPVRQQTTRLGNVNHAGQDTGRGPGTNHATGIAIDGNIAGRIPGDRFANAGVRS